MRSSCTERSTALSLSAWTLARDAGAFGERREFDFVVLAIGKIAVARLEREGSFLQLVAGAAHAPLLALQLGGA